jgi:hypothetical protein
LSREGYRRVEEIRKEEERWVDCEMLFGFKRREEGGVILGVR